MRPTRPGLQSAAAAMAALLLGSCASDMQVPDSSFAPSLGDPAFPAKAGPLVLVDEGHGNFHKLSGRFVAFGKLVANDGFGVRASNGKVTPEALAGAKLLVIANALDESNRERWALPIAPAFGADEVATIRAWVEGGGGLLLIADHMPFPGAVESLAAAFGFRLGNGFASWNGQRNFTLSRANGGLRAHAIVDGRDADSRIDSVRVFTGSAFRSDAPVETLLVLGAGSEIVLPSVAWEFSKAPREPAVGMMQGAVRTLGKGRVGVFAEAAMFTAQLSGPKREPVGMNAPAAPQNARFARSVVRWLAAVEP